ncbi:MAG: hypothetical protein QXU98_14675 [Candidatus Parvarchaeota archaeon]
MSETLVGLHQAMSALEQLKADITIQATNLEQTQNDEFMDTIKNINEQVKIAYLFAVATTKLLEIYYISPENRESIKQSFTIGNDILKLGAKTFSDDLESSIKELDTYVEKNKNVIKEQYATEIKNYAELLRKFREAFTNFEEELNKHIAKFSLLLD